MFTRMMWPLQDNGSEWFADVCGEFNAGQVMYLLSFNIEASRVRLSRAKCSGKLMTHEKDTKLYFQRSNSSWKYSFHLISHLSLC